MTPPIATQTTAYPPPLETRSESAALPSIEFDRTTLEHSIPDRFEEQVRQFPLKPAISTPTASTTYTQLNQMANRLAHKIIASLGEELQGVALLLETGPAAITGMLAALKGNKFYVTLDPLFPEARLATMLVDSQAGLLVTRSQYLPLAERIKPAGCRLINLDILSSDLPIENPNLSILSQTLSHLVYTSGSTGQPKGIMHTHRSVLHNIMNYTHSLQIQPEDHLTLLHSCSFSSATVDIFCSLLNGATLYAWDVKERGLINLAAWLRDQQVSILNWAPTPFRHLLDGCAQTESFPHMRLVLLGSEPLAIRDVEQYRQHFLPHCRLVNRLGTSETGNFRFYFIDHNTEIDGSVVPAGYSVPDKEVILIDDQGRPIGAGEIGEITINSRYIALGYWQQPELTQGAFRPAPDDPTLCTYHTGDLGLIQPDGRLFHMGRKDFQVKIRGHRIEVAEIEAALARLDSIKDAIVMARPDHSGKRSLGSLLPCGR